MGSRPLRMKVRWGCPPQVLSPPPHRTQSWQPCLPGQPWASGWRSTDRPVPSPRGWTIGFSERGAAHNRALPRCLSSRRCMRSWRVCGWPLSRPEAARPPPPSSLPSMAEWPGGTRAFPRWREWSRCTCAHETPPLGGTVRFSRPRPVSWQPLSRPKLTVLRARQPPPCTPWLSCRFTKPRRSNRCTRVVPTRGWCRSCARRLTSLYERRKSRRGPSGRRCPPWWSRSAISGSTWQRWRMSTRHAFSTPPSPREGCSATPSRASPSSSRRYSSRPRRSRGDGENSAAPSPDGGPGGESSVSFCFCSAAGPRASGTHLLKERAISFSSGFSGPWDDSVRRPASSLSPMIHFASSQESTVRGWHSSPRCPACLAGSRAQFDSATRFSSPGDLPSSTAFLRRRWQSRKPLSCARRLLSSWQRMQSSRSLQPRWGRGFTALTSSYPRKVVAFGQSWICESWTGLCTSSRSRCWRTGAWSNAFSPRIGLQRSTWRTLTFTFRSFRDTDRFYGLCSKVGHGSTGSSPSGSPCLPVCSRRL